MEIDAIWADTRGGLFAGLLEISSHEFRILCNWGACLLSWMGDPGGCQARGRIS